MAAVVREIKRKYDPAAGGTHALDAVKTMTGTAGITAVSQQDEQLLDTVCYDTADLRLIGAGITLRRRTGGGDAGWHLKLPAGADTRDEIRLPLATPGGRRAATPNARAGGAVPGQLAASVRAYTQGAALAPVMRIQTRRSVLRLLGGAGQILAEIVSHYDPLVRRDELDAVHQMPVATRRARGALQALGGIIERDATRPLCAELKWLAAALGPASDTEVLLARLTAELAAVPPARPVRRRSSARARPHGQPPGRHDRAAPATLRGRAARPTPVY